MPMTERSPKLWWVARLGAVAGVGTLAILFLSSWALAILVGTVTIAAVAIDGWLMSRSETDQFALDPNATPADKLTVDLRHRR